MRARELPLLMVHLPSAHASVRTCSYIYWLVVVVVVGVGCMRDVVTSEAGDWLRPCHWLAGWLARALEQWSEPTVTGDTAAPVAHWLPGCCCQWLAWSAWLTGATVTLHHLHHLHAMPCI